MSSLISRVNVRVYVYVRVRACVTKLRSNKRGKGDREESDNCEVFARFIIFIIWLKFEYLKILHNTRNYLNIKLYVFYVDL